MTWTKLPSIPGSMACLTCGCGAREHLEMDRQICVGFGDAGYMRDGVILWQESPSDEEEIAPTVGDVEALAVADPDHDWRIWFDAPLYSATYQRQGPEQWVLVDKGMGFAC